MSWVKLDDLFAEHPKIMCLSDKAFRAHVTALLWSARYLTDGRIPFNVSRRTLTPSSKVRAELEEAGLWRREGDDYVIHDYLEYNPPREQVLADREISRRRSAMNANPELARAIKSRDGHYCRYCGVRVNWRDRKSSTGGTYDHVIPVNQGGDESVDNLVVACRDCNGRKGPRTPEQAEMFLLDAPQTESRRILNATQTTPTRPVPQPLLPSVEEGIGNGFDVGEYVDALKDSTEETLVVLVGLRRHLPEAAFRTALESLERRRGESPPLVSETRYFVAALGSMRREGQYA